MTDKSATPLLAEEALISLLEESVTAANVVNSGVGDIGVCWITLEVVWGKLFVSLVASKKIEDKYYKIIT